MNTVIDLERAIINRDKAEAELLKAIREDARMVKGIKESQINQADYGALDAAADMREN